MTASTADRNRDRAMDEAFVGRVAEVWPDILGGVRVWTGPESFVQVGYFTSEAEAREGEQREPPPEVAREFEGFEDLMVDVEFLDIGNPMLA